MISNDRTTEKTCEGARTTQATLWDVTDAPEPGTDDEEPEPETDPFSFDEYGPTMDRPIPAREEHYLPGTDGIDYRELPGTGLDPWDFKLLSGERPTNRDIRNDRHPGDKHRPREHKAHGEAMARAAALEAIDGGEA